MDDVRFIRLGDVSGVDIAPGFVAITRTAHLREALARILAGGGAIFAALQGSLLIGYAADAPVAPVDGGGKWSRRWEALRDVREGAIEVARGFRNAGVARRLLAEVTSTSRLDDAILIGEALVWHWDLKGVGSSANVYRTRLLALLCAAGFRRYETDETEISASEHNFLVARIGPRVSDYSRRAFEAALFANGSGRSRRFIG